MTLIEKLATILGIFAVTVPAAIYVVRTEDRIKSLEAQVSTMGTGIAISKSFADQNGLAGNQDIVINPLWARCDDLADRTAKAIEEGRTLTTANSLQDLMRQLNCDGSGSRR